MSLKLITELNEETVTTVELNEETGDKNFYIEGIYLQSNVKNRNGRIYPKEVLQKEVARYIKESIEKNRAVGELGHPDGPAINLPLVSHKIVSLREEGDNFIGKALITNTPNGAIVKGLLEAGVTLGVSSRGLGSLKEVAGVPMVQEDFYLATAADIVADPSAPEAFVQGIMEGREWIMESGVFKPVDIEKQIEITKRKINNVFHKKDRTLQEKTMMQEFERFMRHIIE